MSKILLIEDDKDLQEGLRFSLEMDGYEVDSVGTRKDGEILIHKNDYELIIMDCNLPDGNGFEICRRIRSKSQIPILMLTARDTEMDEQRTGGIGGKDSWQWVEQWRDWMVCRTARQPGERTSQRN